jgi:hypothetical protein
MSFKDKSYDDKIHFIGRISVAAIILGSLLLPLTLWLGFGLLPEMSAYAKGATTILSIMIPVAFAEFMGYVPLVGSAGYYLMTVTGNLSNIKLPVSVVALQAAEVESGTDEADALSTIAISLSAVTTMVIIFLGLILMAPLSPVLNGPTLKPALSQIIPALFGALTFSFVLRNAKAAIVPAIMAFIFVFFAPIPSYFNIPAIILCSVIITRILYKVGFFTPKEKAEA